MICVIIGLAQRKVHFVCYFQGIHFSYQHQSGPVLGVQKSQKVLSCIFNCMAIECANRENKVPLSVQMNMQALAATDTQQLCRVSEVKIGGDQERRMSRSLVLLQTMHVK